MRNRTLTLNPMRRTPDGQAAVIDWKNHKRFSTTGLMEHGRFDVTIEDTQWLIALGYYKLEFRLPNGKTLDFQLVEASPHSNKRVTNLQQTRMSHPDWEPSALFMTEDCISDAQARPLSKWRKGSLWNPQESRK